MALMMINQNKKKKKKNEKVEPIIAPIEEVVDNSTPFKGKPSSFFVMT